jgi:hypothetical protein
MQDKAGWAITGFSYLTRPKKLSANEKGTVNGLLLHFIEHNGSNRPGFPATPANGKSNEPRRN